MKRTRRGKRKSSKKVEKALKFLGVNAAGLKSKLATFKKVVTEQDVNVFFLQETKAKTTGTFKLENFIIFEKVRTNQDGGGGIALGCQKDLCPVWVREGDKNVETISVNISIRSMSIRLCSAYGPQEDDNVDIKEAFWKYIDEDVIQAEHTGSGFVLQMDGNLWAGSEIVPGDPRKRNRNGKLFSEFLARHPALSVVNALPQCTGLITRRRQLMNGKQEESVLDFFVVCKQVLPHVMSMLVDEKKKYVLTNYAEARKGGKATDTDHATEIMEMNLKVEHQKPQREQIFLFKDTNQQEIF